MKKQLLGIAAGAAFLFNTSNAEIVLTDDLSTYGYMDIAYTDSDAAGAGDATDTVAEFELGFDFSNGDSPFSATMELSFNGTGNDEVDFETATISYAYSDELSFTVGNILTYQGWETFDATGLYQYSYAYRGLAPIYTASYAVGASADYSTDDFGLGFWIGDSANGDVSLEFFGQYTGIENLTLTAIYADDPGYETINFWASYEWEAFTFAAEYVTNDKDGAADDEGFLLLANYAFNDAAAATLRYSEEDEDGLADFSMITISPSYVFSDNVLGLVEVSFVDEASDYTAFAVELLYTF